MTDSEAPCQQLLQALPRAALAYDHPILTIACRSKTAIRRMAYGKKMGTGQAFEDVFYTGPNELSVIPMRINIATRTDAITGPELQILVGAEIRTIITRKPDLKPLTLPGEPLSRSCSRPRMRRVRRIGQFERSFELSYPLKRMVSARPSQRPAILTRSLNSAWKRFEK